MPFAERPMRVTERSVAHDLGATVVTSDLASVKTRRTPTSVLQSLARISRRNP